VRFATLTGTLASMGSPAGVGGEEGTPSPNDLQIDVRLVGVRKDFGDVTAVDGIDLEIGRGEFFSLLGPSGCGKTTTLRMIGGFELPDEGVIELDGVDVAGLPPHRRDVNTVFQSYALFPHLNVFDNVGYGLRRKGLPRAEIAQRVPRILELVNLSGFEGRRVTQLSGGQAQRVALARALVNEPKVLLLDEPLGALDLKLRKQMQLFLKALQHEVGITFIYVTHDQEEAMTMSDRIAVMRDGRVEQVGPPEDVYERPATEFVAGFLGASNLLEGEAAAGDNGSRLVTLSSGERLTIPTGEGRAGRIRLGVRPEKIRISAGPDGADSGDNVVEGRVIDATFVGVSNVYTVETGAGGTMIVYAQNLGTSSQRPPGPGESVQLSWHPEHTFIVHDPEGSTVD
jgi:spermidine/putrescine transport system ATP-binding protein